MRNLRTTRNVDDGNGFYNWSGEIIPLVMRRREKFAKIPVRNHGSGLYHDEDQMRDLRSIGESERENQHKDDGERHDRALGISIGGAWLFLSLNV